MVGVEEGGTGKEASGTERGRMSLAQAGTVGFGSRRYKMDKMRACTEACWKEGVRSACGWPIMHPRDPAIKGLTIRVTMGHQSDHGLGPKVGHRLSNC